MRERLTPPAIRSSSAPNPMIPDAAKDTVVDRHYFDRVVQITSDRLQVVVFPGTYGPFPLLSPPEQVLRSIVQGFALVGSPSAYFRRRFYWTLGLSGGPAQEFLSDTLFGIATNVDAGQTAKVLPATRWGQHGYLDDLETVRILVKQGAQLQLYIHGGDPSVDRDTPNCTVRMRGVHEFAKVDL